mgnify:CR=1 FL=1
MKGVSKEIPWPGSRCGWIEVYNADKDENFRGYIHTIVANTNMSFKLGTMLRTDGTINSDESVAIAVARRAAGAHRDPRCRLPAGGLGDRPAARAQRQSQRIDHRLRRKGGGQQPDRAVVHRCPRQPIGPVLPVPTLDGRRAVPDWIKASAPFMRTPSRLQGRGRRTAGRQGWHRPGSPDSG